MTEAKDFKKWFVGMCGQTWMICDGVTVDSEASFAWGITEQQAVVLADSHNMTVERLTDALEQAQAEVELWKQRALSEDTPTERMIERLEAWESTARGVASDVIAMAKAFREIQKSVGTSTEAWHIAEKALQIAGVSNKE